MRIYLCPALLDWLVFLVLFAVLYSAGERGVSTIRCAWLGGAFQISYMLASLALGFIVNHRNARVLLLVSTTMSALMGVFCLLTQAYVPLLIGMVVLSFSMSVFFNAFQAFMRNETIPGGLAWTVGIYTLAWSVGAGGGVLSSGLFYRFGPYVLSGITLAVGAAIITALVTYKTRQYRSGGVELEEVIRGSRPAAPIYIIIGWLIIFTSMFIQRPLHTFFPKISAEIGTSASWTGLPLFLNMLIQGLVGLGMAKLPGALYRRMPLVLIHAAGIAICGMILLQPGSFAVTFAGVSLLGICSGGACFLSVYFASNSGNRSINIGVNEFLVGMGSFAGLFAAEWWITATRSHHALYQVFAAGLLVSMLIQTALATFFRGRPRGGSRGH